MRAAVLHRQPLTGAVETGERTRAELREIRLVSTLSRLMLKVHSLVVVMLHYAAGLICIAGIKPLYWFYDHGITLGSNTLVLTGMGNLRIEFPIETRMGNPRVKNP